MEEKKKYITPAVVAMLMNTADVMKASSESDKPIVPGVTENPGGSAPARRTEVF